MRPVRAVVLALTVCAFLVLAGSAHSADVIRVPAAEAAGHVGEIAEVCGRVASAAHIGAVDGEPTFLNFERPYPDQLFTVVIWGGTRARFEGRPERMFDGREVCVTGRIEEYNGRPQIVVDDPSQIALVSPSPAVGELTETERVLVKALLSSLGHEANYGSSEWDEEAVEAMTAFQEEEGLAPTGTPDAETLRALADAVGEVPDAELDLVIRLLLFEAAARAE